jgi:hypothetical protein
MQYSSLEVAWMLLQKVIKKDKVTLIYSLKRKLHNSETIKFTADLRNEEWGMRNGE